MKASDHGTLIVEPILMGDPYGGFEAPAECAQNEPLLFRRVDGNGWIAFEQDTQGRITHLNSGNQCHGAYERLAWYETTTIHLIGALPMFFLIDSEAGFPAIAFVEPLPALTQMVLYLPLLIATLTLVMVIHQLFHRTRWWSVPSRWFLCTGVVILCFLTYLANWNLLFP